MRTENEVLSSITTWAHENPNIVAVVLTSSRANPNAQIDFLSDYDIELLVENRSLFDKNDDWLLIFGTILVKWPLAPRTTFDENWLTRLVLFEDGVRIDFQITSQKNAYPLNIDYGYKILLDKNGILSELQNPSYSKYNVSKPTNIEYENLINDFFWDAMYVPKHLKRDELPFVKKIMSQSIHGVFLNKILCWYIGFENDWKVNTGKSGSNFKKYLSKDIWKEYISTFSDSDLKNCWDAFFNGVDLFVKIAKYVGKVLSYKFPEAQEIKMRKYYQYIQKRNEIL